MPVACVAIGFQVRRIVVVVAERGPGVGRERFVRVERDAESGAVSIAGAPLVHRLIPSGRRQPGQEETVAGSAAAAQTGGRIGPGAIFGGGLARITLPAMLVSIVNLAGYWGAAFWIPTFLTQERGLSVEAMLGLQVWAHPVDKHSIADPHVHSGRLTDSVGPA